MGKLAEYAKKVAARENLLTDSVTGVFTDIELFEAARQRWFGDLTEEEAEETAQPSSADTPIADVAVPVADDFQLKPGQTVERALKDANCWQDRFSLTKKRLMKKGQAYAIKLRGPICIPRGFYVETSTKSTAGRRFERVYTLVPDQSRFEKFEGDGTAKDCWICYRPQVFNTFVQEGYRFNQMRVWCGRPTKLTDAQLHTAVNTWGIYRDLDGIKVPVDKVSLDEGLELFMDMMGARTDGIVGLRARNTKEPIDAGVRGLPIEELIKFYEPIKADGVYSAKWGDRLLCATNHRVAVPPMLCAQMTDVVMQHSFSLFHLAGFFDEFFGYDAPPVEKMMDPDARFGCVAVYEVLPLQKGGVKYTHNMTCGKLEFHKMRRMSFMHYGADVGSSYSNQVGVQPPKNFKRITDYSALLQHVSE